jgi:uncharacterized membrane protein (UPF0127 family)
MTAVRSQPLERKTLRIAFMAMCGLLILGSYVPLHAQIGPIEELSAFPSGKLEISDGRKLKLDFQVWLADTPQRQSQGLMFVRSLPDMRGMLFVHDESRPMSMWMKNTYIPLDMVFIDNKGRIEQIVEQTTPHSLALIQSKEPALAVLEIAGGEAKRLGIHAGQQVSHPALVGH